MRLFECQSCGQVTHFDNVVCLQCGHRLGYVPDRTVLSAIEADGAQWTALADPDRRFLLCDNAETIGCNWLVPADGGPTLCESCRHTRTIPDLTVEGNAARWAKMEAAKRYLFYSLIRWNLPRPTLAEAPQAGLVFDFLADTVAPDGSVAKVLTGHASGVITINIAEADDAEREKRRVEMREPYRTLLGHMRHEVGHYYWDVLVRDGGQVEPFRALFGDESADYGAALQRHYEAGPPADWDRSFISTYATAHPWEDFAETWAHYLHMVDALETAGAFGLRTRPRVAEAKELTAKVDFDPYDVDSAQTLIEAWVPLTVAINAINRAMGQPDLYPFVLNEPVERKLEFMRGLVQRG